MVTRHRGADSPGAVGVLHGLCGATAERVRDPELRTLLRAVARQLELPLQLAVAGAVSAGKSTLVNALLGRPVAPVDAGECTRVVTWYVHGPDDGQVDMDLVSGGTATTRLAANGRLPVDLGVPVEDVARLRVQLDDPRLATIAVIDTPGANTVTAENEERTRRVLFGDAAAEHAQALIYVARHVQTFDAGALGEFRALSAACHLTAVNTAMVLAQVDRAGDESDERDPWPTARRRAAKAERDLRGLVVDVAPVVGLLAQTARTRLLGPDDVAALRRFAVLPDDEFDDLLTGGPSGVVEDAGDVGVDPGAASSLIAKLHLYGLRTAVTLVRDDPGVGLDDLHAQLDRASGFGAAGDDDRGTTTVATVLDRFVRHADRLKALAAMGRIQRLAAHRHRLDADERPALDTLLAAVDDSRPVAVALRELRVLSAVDALGTGVLSLDDDMSQDLMALARHDRTTAQLGLPAGSDDDAVADALRTKVRRWRAAASFAGPTRAGHRIRDVLRALEEMAAERSAAPGAPSGPPGSGASGPAGPGLPDGLVDRLRTVEVLDDEQRRVLAALADGTDLQTALGGTAARVAAGAADQARRYRALAQRPVPGSQRRALREACAAFENLVHTMRSPTADGR